MNVIPCGFFSCTSPPTTPAPPAPPLSPQSCFCQFSYPPSLPELERGKRGGSPPPPPPPPPLRTDEMMLGHSPPPPPRLPPTTIHTRLLGSPVRSWFVPRPAAEERSLPPSLSFSIHPDTPHELLSIHSPFSSPVDFRLLGGGREAGREGYPAVFWRRRFLYYATREEGQTWDPFAPWSQKPSR